MKALLINRRIRTLLSGLVVLVLMAVVWWCVYYKKQVTVYHSLGESYKTALHRLERLENKKQALKKENLANQDKQDDLKRLSSLLVGSASAEANTETQKLLRAFGEKHKITLETYIQIQSVKWRDNLLIRLNYQFRCGQTELSALLSFLEGLEKVIRIEQLDIQYLKGKDKNLRVSLRLGILSISKETV